MEQHIGKYCIKHDATTIGSYRGYINPAKKPPPFSNRCQSKPALCLHRNNTSDSFHGPWKTAELQLLTLVSPFCPTCNASISLVAVSTADILYISKVRSNLNEKNKQNHKHQQLRTNQKSHVKMYINGKANGQCVINSLVQEKLETFMKNKLNTKSFLY